MLLTRTRRRILIATLLLIGVLALGWWKLRLRHDPRLIGKWETPEGSPFLTNFYLLNADGSGETWIKALHETLPEQVIQWSCDGKSLVLNRPGLGRHFSQPARKLLWRVFRKDLSGEELARFDVVSIGPEELVMTNHHVGKILRWQRVPD